MAEVTRYNEEIHGQNAWNEYVEEQKEIFRDLSIRSTTRTYIKIRNIPNIDEFQELIDVLKDKYGTIFTEFLIIECGFVVFYDIYQSSGLFGATEVIKMIHKRFNSKYQEGYQTEIAESILEKNRPDNYFYLHVLKKQKIVIEKLLMDIKLKESNFGLICCIFTFNSAKEEFKELTVDRFESYYKHDGYLNTIKEEINDEARKRILCLINYLPNMLEEIENDIISIRRHKERREKVDPKIKNKLLYKIDTVEHVINVIEKNKTLLHIEVSLDDTIERKNRLKSTPF